MSFTSASATPFGLRPVRYKNGTPWNGAGNWYYCPSTDAARIGMYEPVATTGTAEAATGLKQVTRYTAGTPVIGSAVGFLPAGAFSPLGTQSSLAAPSTLDVYHYRPGSTSMWIMVADDPNIVFQMQEDGAATPIVVANIGLNADLIAAANCSTVTGLSVAAIDSDTVATTSTLDLKILGLSSLLDGSNSISDDYKMFDVMINTHELGQGLGSLGV